MPRQTSVQLTESTQRQVAALTDLGFGTFTDIARIAIDRMYNQEIEKETKMKNPTFKTYAEAYAAGYRRVDRSADRDISGGSYYGYEYQRASDGQKTVNVWLSEEKNQLGQLGCVAPMYPPD
jgi:hypothetical protein